jgi:hypothetical protein
MLPCSCRRWLFAVRASSMNGEMIVRWGWTERQAIRRFMVAWETWIDWQARELRNREL